MRKSIPILPAALAAATAAAATDPVAPALAATAAAAVAVSATPTAAPVPGATGATSARKAGRCRRRERSRRRECPPRPDRRADGAGVAAGARRWAPAAASEAGSAGAGGGGGNEDAGAARTAPPPGPRQRDARPPEPGDVFDVRADADVYRPGAARATIDVAARRGEAVTVADLLDETPGVQVRSAGGAGAFSSVSIRGADGDQTAVYYDGVPLSRAHASQVDLSDTAAAGLERIVVWRGLPPVDRMGAGPGGVIDLIPSREPGGEARGSGGSFGTRGAFARQSALLGAGALGRVAAGASVDYLGSEGDFPYRDHRGTRFANVDDDATRLRGNNDFDQVEAIARAEGRRPVPLRALATAFFKDQGVPGLLHHPAPERTRLRSARGLAHLRAGAPERAGAAAHVVWQRDRFSDPDSETGLFGPQDDLGTTWAAGGEARGGAALGPASFLLVPQALHERYRIDHRIEGPYPDIASSRTVLGLGARGTLRLLGGAAAVEPSLRLDHARDADGDDSHDTLLVSPRAGARVTVLRGLDAIASAGDYHRLPTLIERFGDGATIAGREDLAPETGRMIDGALIWHPGRAIALEAGGFATFSDDLIVLQPASPSTLRPRNIGRARVIGAEAAATARLHRRLAVRAAYTRLWTENRSDVDDERGHGLPGRAPHKAYARAESRGWRAGPAVAGVFADADLVSSAPIDASGSTFAPARALVGAGAEAAPARLRRLIATVEVRNLLDQREGTVHQEVARNADRVEPLQDFYGHPLPGRALYASLRYRY